MEFRNMTKRVLVGLGNPYMRDDGVGRVVAGEFERLSLPDLQVFQDYSPELSWLQEFRGASRVVLVDALMTGAPPGKVTTLRLRRQSRSLDRLPNLHSLQVHDVLDLARSVGVDVPLTLVGVEPADCSPGLGLSDVVRAAVPLIIDAARKELM